MVAGVFGVKKKTARKEVRWAAGKEQAEGIEQVMANWGQSWYLHYGSGAARWMARWTVGQGGTTSARPGRACSA
jgi:hypothetical protein